MKCDCSKHAFFWFGLASIIFGAPGWVVITCLVCWLLL